jgi:hypothetical protein
MKRYIKLNFSTSVVWIFFVTIFSSCVLSNPQLFSSVQNTSDTTYGYLKSNPISFTNGGMKESTDALYYYLNHLRTENGKKLIPIRQYALDNPEYNPSKFSLKDKFSEHPGLKGRFLDLMILQVENESDTIELFFNISKKDTIRVPVGLKFVK